MITITEAAVESAALDWLAALSGRWVQRRDMTASTDRNTTKLGRQQDNGNETSVHQL